MELRRVVVTGLGALTPIGNSVPEYWKALLDGVSGAGPITHFDPTKFKTRFACELKGFNVLDFFSTKDVKRMDPCVQYALVTTQEAIEDSGLELDKTDKERVGVIFGSGVGGLTSMMESITQYVNSGKTPRFSPFMILQVLTDMISGFISLKYGFKGPNYVTGAACASAANAIADAFWLVQSGKVDVVITGGTEASVVETSVGGFNAMHALSVRNDDPEHASRPFDTERDGFVMGEGAATLILEDLDHARARGAKIYGELAGVGMAADAFHTTAPDPSGAGAVRCMKLALQDAGFTPDKIDYVNMHGTSTQIGDIAECLAVEKVFGVHADKMVINSTKSMTGHLLGAGPAIESVAVLLSIAHDIVHPTINIEHVDPRIPATWNLAAHGAVKHTIRAAITNSFGFGGHNVTLLYKKYNV